MTARPSTDDTAATLPSQGSIVRAAECRPAPASSVGSWRIWGAGTRSVSVQRSAALLCRDAGEDPRVLAGDGSGSGCPMLDRGDRGRNAYGRATTRRLGDLQRSVQ